MSKVNICLDATMLDTFSTCECKFNYRFNLNKVTIEKAKPLDRGTLIHVGFETYYKGLKEEKKFTDRIDESLVAIRLASLDCDLDSTTVQRILDVMVENLTFWKTADEKRIILNVETPFSYSLHEDDSIRIIMIGKIDLLTNEHGYSNLPSDHKSYDRDYPVRRLTNQFCNYAYATGSNYLIVNKVGFQTTLKPVEKYKRIPLSYDPLILEQWKQNVVLTAYKYLECVSSGNWPLNLTSCDKYNRQCEYYEVCDSSGIEAKIYKLEANFNVGEVWDVSKSLGEKK